MTHGTDTTAFAPRIFASRVFVQPRRVTLGPLLPLCLLHLCLLATSAGPVLCQSVRLSGRVVDPQGNAIADAKLELLEVDASYAYHASQLLDKPPRPAASEVADVQGRFVLPADEGIWRLRVKARGFSGASLIVPLAEALDLGDVTLERARTVALTVRDAAGRPLPSALVGARTRSTDPHAESSTRLLDFETFEHVGRTDAQGRWTFDAPTQAPFGLWICAAQGTLGSRFEAPEASMSVVVPAASSRRIRVLRPKAESDRQAPAQEPVARAVVAVNGLPCALTDAAGNTTVPADAGASLIAEGPTGERARLRIGSEQPTTEPIELTLDPRRIELSGTVSNALDGSPVAGALVWAWREPAWHTTTSANGRYVLSRPFPMGLESVDANQALDSLRVAAPWFFPGRASLTAGRLLEQTGPEILLDPAGRIEGRVLDEDNVPVAGASVQPSSRVTGSNTAATLTAADGTFALAPLRTGQTAQLVVGKEGYAPTWKTVPALQTLEPQEITVRLGRGGRIVGQVHSAVGAAVAGATVTAFPAVGDRGDLDYDTAYLLPRRPAATTDQGGSFEITHLSEGDHDLWIEADGFAPAQLSDLRVTPSEGALDVGVVELEEGKLIDGLVTDPEGRPLAGAEVTTLSHRPPSIFAARAHQPDAVSDERGRFQLRNLPQEGITLYVHLEGYVNATENLEQVESEQRMHVVLEHALRVAGRVVDGTGSPIAYASVQLEYRQPQGSSSQTTMSERDGSFSVDGLSPGTWLLSATAADFQPMPSRAVEVGGAVPTDDLRLVLERGATLSGRVLGADGAPLPMAAVRLAASPYDRVARSFVASTDAAGNYHIGGLPLGTASFVAEHPTHRKALRDVDIGAGDNHLDFALDPALSLSGTVVDAESGLPLGGAVVNAATSNLTVAVVGGAAGDAATAEDGSFTLPIREAGRYFVTVRKRGFASYHASQPLAIVDRSVADVVIELRHGATVIGRVLGLDPAELPSVAVLAKLDGAPSAAVRGSASPDGTYRIDNLGPGQWTLTAFAPARSATARVSITESSIEESVDLELSPRGALTLSGTVLRGGEPAVGATVGTVRSDAGVPYQGGGQSRTDSDGSFRIEGLEPGTYQLLVSQNSQGASLPHIEKIELSGDQEIVVELPSTRALAGRVVDDATGEPVSGASLAVAPTDRPLDVTFVSPVGLDVGLSSGNGTFRLEELEAGTYQVRAAKAGYAHGNATVTVREDQPESFVTLRLARGTGLTLRARGTRGLPLSSVTVALLNAQDQAVAGGSYVVGEQGRVRLESVPEGDWTLLVSSPSQATASYPVTTPGPEVRVQLPPAGSLLVSTPGSPGMLAKLQLFDAAGNRHHQLSGNTILSEWFLEHGKARIPVLHAGRWQVVLTDLSGRVLHRGVVDVLPDSEAEVTLE